MILYSTSTAFAAKFHDMPEPHLRCDPWLSTRNRIRVLTGTCISGGAGTSQEELIRATDFVQLVWPWRELTPLLVGLTMPFTKIASPWGGIPDYDVNRQRQLRSNQTELYSMTHAVEPTSGQIGDDSVRENVPAISASTSSTNSHPVRKHEDPLFVIVLAQLQRVVDRMHDQSADKPVSHGVAVVRVPHADVA